MKALPGGARKTDDPTEAAHVLSLLVGGAEGERDQERAVRLRALLDEFSADLASRPPWTPEPRLRLVVRGEPGWRERFLGPWATLLGEHPRAAVLSILAVVAVAFLLWQWRSAEDRLRELEHRLEELRTQRQAEELRRMPMAISAAPPAPAPGLVMPAVPAVSPDLPAPAPPAPAPALSSPGIPAMSPFAPMLVREAAGAADRDGPRDDGPWAIAAFPGVLFLEHDPVGLQVHRLQKPPAREDFLKFEEVVGPDGAGRKGLEVGDVILKVAGRKIVDAHGFGDLLASHEDAFRRRGLWIDLDGKDGRHYRVRVRLVRDRPGE